MKNNLLAIFEELAKVNTMKADAKAGKEVLEDKLYNIIDKSLSFKEKMEARKKFSNTIEVLNSEINDFSEKIKFLNMYSIALKAEALAEVKAIIAQNLIDNFSKIDGVPARYKKVKNLINCYDCDNIGAYYNEYYEVINIYIKGEGNNENHFYFAKHENGEAVTDIERCKKAAEYIARTPQDIAENIERFINAQKELEKAAKEYNEKVNAIKEGCFCLGLEFEGRY